MAHFYREELISIREGDSPYATLKKGEIKTLRKLGLIELMWPDKGRVTPYYRVTRRAEELIG